MLLLMIMMACKWLASCEKIHNDDNKIYIYIYVYPIPSQSIPSHSSSNGFPFRFDQHTVKTKWVPLPF